MFVCLIGIQKYMYKLTVHHFVICSINRFILSKTSFQKCVPSALKILRGTSVIQKQDLLLVFNWIYLWRVYINQINERKAIFLTQHPNISLNKEGVWSTNLREIISEIHTDRQTKTEQRAHLNRHPTVSPDFNTSLWFLLMHSIGPWNYISWSFCMFPICLWDLGTSHWSLLWFED